MRSKRKKQLSRKKRVRSKIYGKADCPRLSVFRSNRYVYAQLIDDESGKTLVAASQKELLSKSSKKSKKEVKKKQSKTEIAGMVGGAIAKKALKKKVSKVIFDRGSYKYHGRVKAFAEGARKGGLKF